MGEPFALGRVVERANIDGNGDATLVAIGLAGRRSYMPSSINIVDEEASDSIR